MSNQTIYGPDGITLAETIIDNGDDTAIRTTYDENGNILDSGTIEWDSTPFVDNAPVVIPQSAIDQLASDLADPSVNTIVEIKASLKNFVDSI